jgi:hypothetical protein
MKVQKQGKPVGGTREGRSRLRWMHDVELDFRNVGVKSGEQELLTERNGHLSCGKPRPNLKYCSAEHGEEIYGRRQLMFWSDGSVHIPYAYSLLVA